jgi:hypothetical protein
MNVNISSDAELDLNAGFRFYEDQATGLGNYFRDCLVADIEALCLYGGIHARVYGYHRMLSARFPFAIYYEVFEDAVTVVAVLDCRRDPFWIRNRLQHGLS